MLMFYGNVAAVYQIKLCNSRKGELMSINAIVENTEKDRKTLVYSKKGGCSNMKNMKAIKQWQRWDSNPRLRRDWCLKPAP